MYGVRSVPTPTGPRPVRVLVLIDVVAAGSAAASYSTHTIACIDPPLLIGLSLSRQTWLGSFAPSPQVLGDRALDDALRFGALDAARGAVLLTSRGGPAPRLADRLAALDRDTSFDVTDSAVDLHVPEEQTSWRTLGPRVDVAAALAVALAVQNAWLPPDPRRAEILGAWEAFARAEGLTFDAARVEMYGELAGGKVVIALEGQPGVLLTAVVVVLPLDLRLGLRLRPQGPAQALVSLFGGQDILVGDPGFDRRFVVEGHPEKVKALFADAGLREALLALSTGAWEMRVDDRGFFFRYPSHGIVEQQLAELMRWVRTAAERLSPRAAPVGPYR